MSLVPDTRLPVIALVGRPNVGKSTLFNALTRTRDALVVDEPGVTRDRKYGTATVDEKSFIAIDTGGLFGEEPGFEDLVSKQSYMAQTEADALIIVVDAVSGLHPYDYEVIQHARCLKKPLVVAVNKIDGIDAVAAVNDFYALGVEHVKAISANLKRGIISLLQPIWEELKNDPFIDTSRHQTHEPDNKIRLAIVGRPNAGKSTLLNRIIGEERAVVCDYPGTTRDDIRVEFEKYEREFLMIDTAGIRRKAKIKEKVEKFSVVKTLSTIESVDVVVMMIDARVGLHEQDLKLLDFTVSAGKALVICFNKWDHLPQETRDVIKKEIDYKLQFVSFAKKFFISALHGTKVGDVLKEVVDAFDSARKTYSTPQVTKILRHLIERHEPPIIRGRRIKLRYAHMGGIQPTRFVIHGNQTKSVPGHYKRYLMNGFIKALNLSGSPVKLEFVTSENPYVNHSDEKISSS